jgi:DNA polymerase-1
LDSDKTVRQMIPITPKKERLFLIDGSALAYRSYFAFFKNPLINSKGVNTGGILGFTNTLMKIIREEQPDYIACVFDTRAPTFRHKLYSEYKATREKMPEELTEQFPVIRKMVEAFQIPLLEEEGYEADDVIGTIVKKAEAEGLDIYIVTGDKDFMQLISERVHMYILGRGNSLQIIGPREVEEKLGVKPHQVIDFMGLMGDSSDNVPGVPGVGPKTAKELIDAFGSLERVLQGADQIQKPKLRESILGHKEQAKLSKELVTICTEVPVTLNIQDFRSKSIDRQRVVDLFQELEFRRLMDELPESADKPKIPEIGNYHTIATLPELDTFISDLARIPMFAVDLETTSLDPILADIVGFSFSWMEGEAFYIPVQFPEMGRSDKNFGVDPKEALPLILKKLKPILEDPEIHKCGQNIKYDMRVLSKHGVVLKGVDFDTMIAAYLINPGARQFGIDALALEYLNIQKIPTKELIGTGQKQITMDLVTLEKIAEYACEDADVAFRLRGLLEPRLSESKMDKLFSQVEMPLVEVLAQLEDNGVRLDTAFLAEMSKNMETQLERLREEIYEIAGETFNINSTQQLGKIMFEKLKVHELAGSKRPKKTKTGYATDIRVLESLSPLHPLPRKVLEYRQFMKLKSTYVDALPALVNPVTHRVHTSFNQAVAATGRLSSSDPNLQNIPIRTDMGREIRRAFVPDHDGWVLLSADYSQIELRIMAHLSGDDTLITSFQNNEDVHKRTALEIFDISLDEVTEDHRRMAKTINFGIMYGMGPFGLARRLEISFEEAQNFITAYFARYPKVNDFIAQTIARAHEDGFVMTLLNRRRYLPELRSSNRNIREFGERTAVNTPIQGTAADLIKVAMIGIANQIKQQSIQGKMILQIHDELVFDVPESEADFLSELVRREMEGAIELSVPVKVDIGIGANWYEAH